LSGQNLKRSECIKNSGIISSVIKEGKRIQGEAVTIHFLPSEKLEFAVLVRKKTGSAVERNKIKRWVREIYRRGKNRIHKQYRIIVVVTKAYCSLDYSVLEKDIQTFFMKISAFK
jgi:ribonuclease P protein component